MILMDFQLLYCLSKSIKILIIYFHFPNDYQTLQLVCEVANTFEVILKIWRLWNVCCVFFSWLSCLEHAKWLQYVSSLLRAATLVVSTIDKEARPVLVHCSDGWDRTPQIVSLAELLLDPYYRTIKVRNISLENWGCVSIKQIYRTK